VEHQPYLPPTADLQSSANPNPARWNFALYFFLLLGLAITGLLFISVSLFFVYPLASLPLGLALWVIPGFSKLGKTSFLVVLSFVLQLGPVFGFFSPLIASWYEFLIH
jgi:hypothetical protein